MPIPDGDADFTVFVNNAMIYINTNMAKWGLTAPQIAPAQAALSTWNVVYPDQQAKQAAARGATEMKDDARYEKPAGLEPTFRELRKFILANPAADDTDREALGAAPQAPPAPPPPAPEPSHPAPFVEQTEHMRIRFGWVDSATGKKKRPSNVKEAELFGAITAQGAAPPPVAQMQYLGRDSQTPYTKEFEDEDVGKSFHLVMRWILSDGTAGSFCPPLTVTVA